MMLRVKNLKKIYLGKWKRLRPNDPIFNLSTGQLRRIVKQCVRDAGVDDAERFSPHVSRAIPIIMMIQVKDLTGKRPYWSKAPR
jgi:hypothetical protein